MHAFYRGCSIGDIAVRDAVAEPDREVAAQLAEPLRELLKEEVPLSSNSRGFALTVNGHFILVTSPGFQAFVSAGSVGP